MLKSKKTNFFEPLNWQTILSMNSAGEWDTKKYHKILCPDFPEFLNKYLELPLLQRLKGIGLLCGTDWTALYKNRFYYSRFDHSLGVALIIWNFTGDKAQTIAGLLHDASTPVFSHVSDFRKGDALTQTATEAPNAALIKNDLQLLKLLQQDQLTVEQVQDYHIYPVADNEIPCLSADRLEYMFPSGASLEGSWKLEEIKAAYENISVLKNELGRDELGFNDEKIALNYCRRFCITGHVLQLNENKLCLQLLGHIMNEAVKLNCLAEADFMLLSEQELLKKLEKNLQAADNQQMLRLRRLYNTFRNMKSIEHTDKQLPYADYFCVSLKVKQRYINPLVYTAAGPKRIYDLSPEAKKIIDDFLAYEDTKFGCVKLED